MNVSTGKILRYAVLPGIFPRIRDFFASGFSHLAVFMAYAYRAARLLPAGHPYLNPANMGKFGLRHVLSEARKNLVFDRHHIDQVIIYYTLLLGVFLLFFQFIIAFFAFIITQAQAQDDRGIGEFFHERFVTEKPEHDIAFMLMDRVFCFGSTGKRENGIFGSSVITENQCTPLHSALHELFHFYNLGVMIIAFVIFLYFVVTVVAETAQSGTPFGRRFNRSMAPIRMILAVGMLIPLTYGMNGAQLITLHIAKWGSGLATNGWNKFTSKLEDQTLMGPSEDLVVKPTIPGINSVVEWAFLANTCIAINKLMRPQEGQGSEMIEIEPYQIYLKDNVWISERMPVSFDQAVGNSENRDIIIRFGEKRDDFIDEKGNVKPACGEIVLRVQDVSIQGNLFLQNSYYKMVRSFYTDGRFNNHGMNIALRMTPTADRVPDAQVPTSEELKKLYIDEWNNNLKRDIDRAYTFVQQDENWFKSFEKYGWGGAGIWYNKIAEMNGAFISSAYNLPTPTLYPEIMEYVKQQRQAHNAFVSGPERFSPYLPDGSLMDFRKAGEEHMALTLYYAQSFWGDVFEKPKGNAFIDTVTALFGLKGLIEISKNVEIHPLAQLAGIGRALIESAMMNLGYAFGTGLMGGIANILGMAPVATVGQAASGFLMNVAMIGLAQGFILFYVLPFLPFLYFFFALASWIKGMFEAMIGLPLWAVAHIRIDGEGIPGQVAIGGYFMLLEIFIRPILTIFGLIAAISIFAAQVRVLHAIWPLVVVNVSGHNPDNNPAMIEGTAIDYFRDASDEFFFMILYTIIVYLCAMSSFKLIDAIPGHILRWMGTGVSNFGDFASDPGGDLMSKSYMGAQTLSRMGQSRDQEGGQGLFQGGLGLLMMRN